MYKEILTKIKKNEHLEPTYSEEEVFKAIGELLLRKSQEHPEADIEELRKNWRKAFSTGLTVLGMIHGAHYMNEKQIPEKKTPEQISQEKQQISEAREKARKEGEAIYEKHTGKGRNKSINKFLQAVSLNESSGGKNTKHSRMEGGIHAGDAAVGNYGLMPNTIKEIANRMGPDHPLSKYRQMESQEIEKRIANNPEHQREFATHLATRLHEKFGGDETKMAYAWNQGHNLTEDHFKKGPHADYKTHDYVQKYQKHRSQIAEAPGDPNPSVATSKIPSPSVASNK